jgi:hypothetical protein
MAEGSSRVLDVETGATPGLLTHKSKIRIALEYENGHLGNSATFEWLDDQNHQEHKRERTLDLKFPNSGTPPRVFDEGKCWGWAALKEGHPTEIYVTAPGLNYNSDFGDLWTTVTITYVDLPNVIKARIL